MELQIIARARNGFSDKFGIPRQPSEDSVIETRIVFEKPYRNPDALRGIEGFSHLWVIWGFDKVTGYGLPVESERKAWSATVRPPRLGGNVRMGVFATRSPNRPNPLGISSVRLLRVEKMQDGSLELVVNGADMLDGTPIYDIKPYLRYSDSHPDARDGFVEEIAPHKLEVIGLEQFSAIGDHVLSAIQEVLEQDPRPAYQNDEQRIYKMDFGGWCVAFNVKKDKLIVLNITKSDRK